MHFQRLTISVPENAADVLARTGNASSYIARALERRWTQWQQALGFLMARGWTNERIVGAMRALNGVSQVERGVFELAANLLRAHAPDIGESETAACVVLAEEWWMGNAEVRRVLLTPDEPPLLANRRRGRPSKANVHPAVIADDAALAG